MRIVVLDGFTLNPGDLSWDGVRASGEVTVHERTPAEQIVARAADADVVVTNKVALNAATIAALPKLKFIAVTATGYNIVDVAAARGRGVVVSNVPAYSTDSVAQLTLGLLLELTSRVGAHARAVAAGEWAGCQDFSFVKGPLVELAAKTIGIVGFGTIGQRVGAVASALGMNVVAMRRSAGPLPAAGYAVRAVDRATLFKESDVVSLHCPLTAENAGFVNAALINTMKSTAIFLNTARGGLVNEADLAAALNSGRIAGAGLDVLSVEPPPASNPLLTAKNCVITPHIAWASFEARQRCMAITVQNVAAFAAGKPVNVVS